MAKVIRKMVLWLSNYVSIVTYLTTSNRTSFEFFKKIIIIQIALVNGTVGWQVFLPPL
jgi:hypothetical protein